MKTKLNTLRIALSATTAIASGLLLALPAAAQSLPNEGGATISTSGLSGGAPGSTNPTFSTTVTDTGANLRVDLRDNRTIINWTNGFNVGFGNTVNFKDARATSGVTGRTDNIAVLNRDTSGFSSYISGTISSDPNVAVYLINRNSIIFTNYGAVDAGAFFASTLDITNDNDFLNGSSSLRFSGAKPGQYLNAGDATFTTHSNGGATGGRMGDVVMISPYIQLGQGSGITRINANGGDVALVAANDVTIQNQVGSPLSMKINSGVLANEAAIMGDLRATSRNFIAAGATGGNVFSGVIAINGSITATGASATDRGIVLTMGSEAPGVSFAVAPSDAPNAAIHPGGTVSLGATDQLSKLQTPRELVLSGSQVNLGINSDIGGKIDLRGGGIQVGASDVKGSEIVLSGTSADVYGKLKSTTGDIVFSGPMAVQLSGGIESARDILGTSLKSFNSGNDVPFLAARDISLTAQTIWIDNLNTRAGRSIFLSDEVAGATSTYPLHFHTLVADTGNIEVRSRTAIGSYNATATLGSVSVRGTYVNLIDVKGAAGVSLIATAGDGEVHARSVTSTAPGADVTINAARIISGDESGVGAAITAGRDAIMNVGSGGTVQLGAVQAGRDVTVKAGTLLAGHVAATAGHIDLQGGVGGGYLSTGNLSAGTYVRVVSPSLTVGNVTASDGDIDLTATSGLTFNGNLIASNDIFARTSSGGITLGFGVRLQGRDIVLSGTGNFNNFSGTQALSARGHWVIYAGSPTASGFGGLNSGNTALWNSALATRAPGTISGNRYVFAYQPTLTFSTVDFSKIYGTDLTNSTTVPFGVSGYHPGVTGAFLGDTAATAFSGTPLITSAGFAERATVAGGPYSQSIALGSLQSNVGYSLALAPSSSGKVTVTPKAINGTVTADTKTYDGTTTGSGTVTLSGALTGDSVGTTAGTFTFADKNAGTAKAVSVSGITLTGADSGNYTLTIPGTVLADILKKALSGTITANNKTYDGTTDASGSVSLSGVIAGDEVATSGLTLHFADKNAGTGKAVTASGALSGADAGNYSLGTLTGQADIAKKAITGTATANNKTYDGTTAGSGSVALDGVLTGDIVSGTATFTFTDKNAGTGKTVTVSGVTLSGLDSGNYSVTLPASALANIFKKEITGNVYVIVKTYDGTTAGSGGVTLNGVVAGDAVSATGTVLTYADKNAGNNKSVSVTGTALTGADAGNYTLIIPQSVFGTIRQKAINANVTANDKTYDGTTGGSGTVTLTGIVAGDTVGTAGTVFTFSDKNAGAGKTVAVSGTMLTGADARNYTVTVPATVMADILRKAITGNVTANGKTYDGTTAASGTVTLNGVVVGDDVAASGTSFAFADKKAGTGKTVTVSGTTLAGADAGNYTLSVPATVLADILKKALTGSVTANGKTYDGTTAGSGTVALNGVVAGDAVTGGATFTFGDKNAGTGKTVTVSGATLSGADAGNYTVTLPASAIADILRKALTANVTVTTKTYDGTTAGSGTVALSGVVSGDTVGTTGTVFTFSDKNAGTGKTVGVSGTALTGADAGNYTLTVPASALGDILKKMLTGTVSADDKTYDGTTAATGTVTVTGIVAGDQVNTSNLTLSFADKNAGTGKTVQLNGAIAGVDAGNYMLPALSGQADILKRAISGSVTAGSKTYDGTTTGSGSVSLNGVLAGDSVTGSATFTFSDKNAGTGKTVAVSGGALGGADAGNYTLTLPATALADILKKALTASVMVDGRTYDGSTAGSGTVTLNGVVAGDAVGTTGTSFTFADKNAGAGKTVTITGTALTGADAGNYTLSIPASAVADIARRQLTITPDALEKNQGEVDPPLTFTVTGGSLVAGDELTGVLGREPGELPGNYAILLGTLSAGSNYQLALQPGTFAIVARLSDAGELQAMKVVTLPAQIQDLSTPNGGVTVDEKDICGPDQACSVGN